MGWSIQRKIGINLLPLVMYTWALLAILDHFGVLSFSELFTQYLNNLIF